MRNVCLALIVLLPLASSAATPPEGVALKVRRGFFTETDIGGFMTLGGQDGYSNLQTYLQLGVGYNIGDAIELGLSVSIGSNAANCWAGKKPNGIDCIEPDNFTLTFLNLTAAYLFRVGDRFYVAPKLTAGWTLLDPPPVKVDANPLRQAPNAGAGVGVEYATSMDHFGVGFDVVAKYVLGPNILALQFFPRVKYTF